MFKYESFSQMGGESHDVRYRYFKIILVFIIFYLKSEAIAQVFSI